MAFFGIKYGGPQFGGPRRGTSSVYDDEEPIGGAPVVPIMPPTGQQLQQNIAQTLAAPPPPGAKPGFFKKGGMGQHMLGGAIGSIGDALTGNSAYADSVSDQRKSMLAEQMAEVKRQQEMDDFIAKERWRQANEPLPSDVRTAQWYRSASKEDRAAYDAAARARAPYGAVPPVTMESGATVEQLTQPGVPGAGGQPRTATGPNNEKYILNPQTNRWELVDPSRPFGSPLGPY